MPGGKVTSVLSNKALVLQDAVADLNQDISATYSEAEVQAISDKVDVILQVLRDAKLIVT